MLRRRLDPGHPGTRVCRSPGIDGIQQGAHVRGVFGNGRGARGLPHVRIISVPMMGPVYWLRGRSVIGLEFLAARISQPAGAGLGYDTTPHAATERWKEA
eukprot:scaffold85149_cov61-Phaeocystis_antarctica.AAC.5